MTEKAVQQDGHLSPKIASTPNQASLSAGQENEAPRIELNGGLDAWLTVAALFCVFVNSWLVYADIYLPTTRINQFSRGILTTYGAFQEYYQTVLLPDQSPSAISWVGSIQATLIPMVGIVSGPLVDSGYLRPLMLSGSFLTVFGLMMTSLATEYYQILLAQGFCVGLGGGISYIPALAIVSTRFTTKRPLAIGCGAIGSSVGAVVFPILFRQLQPRLGFPWAVRCIAFVSLLMAVLACSILCRRPGPRSRARSLIDRSAFRSPAFMMFSLSLTCVMLAYYVPIFYVAAYARSVVRTTPDLSFYMVAVVNGSSVVGRVLPYLLVRFVNPIAVLAFCVAASAVAMFTWIAATGKAGFIVWACYWGVLSGVLVTAPTAIVAHPVFCPDSKFMGTRLGMMWGISSFGSLAGTPIAGALVDLGKAQFLRAQVFAGCLMIGAVLLQSWPLVKVVRYDRGL